MDSFYWDVLQIIGSCMPYRWKWYWDQMYNGDTSFLEWFVVIVNTCLIMQFNLSLINIKERLDSVQILPARCLNEWKMAKPSFFIRFDMFRDNTLSWCKYFWIDTSRSNIQDVSWFILIIVEVGSPSKSSKMKHLICDRIFFALDIFPKLVDKEGLPACMTSVFSHFLAWWWCLRVYKWQDIHSVSPWEVWCKRTKCRDP